MRRWNLLLLVMGAGLACGGALRAPLLAQVGSPPSNLPPAEETPAPAAPQAEPGEAVEQRVESLRVTRQEDGSWRVGSLDKVSADGLRFTDQVPGVTTLRMALRAWHRRDLAAARSLMSPALLKKYQGREETLRAI